MRREETTWRMGRIEAVEWTRPRARGGRTGLPLDEEGMQRACGCSGDERRRKKGLRNRC